MSSIALRMSLLAQSTGSTVRQWNLKGGDDLDRGDIVARGLCADRLQNTRSRGGFFGQDLLPLLGRQQAIADQRFQHKTGREVSSRPLDRSRGGGRGHVASLPAECSDRRVH